jgi:hypothetical protein
MTDFACHVKDGIEEVDRKAFRVACHKSSLYGEYEGKQYCVLHYPGGNKEDEFREAVSSKLRQKSYDFRGTVFPEDTSDFQSITFDAPASLAETTHVGRALFQGAEFTSGVDFSGAEFSTRGAHFRNARFRGELIDFSKANFSGAIMPDGAKHP